ncbi:hypothetical protein GCM10010232_59530 [Streptomyces amakusaensis]|uniref:Uncharacterized protein n=1 Tax=Streptomyces amakusaensis TaxID=67271 RepID=A0ABW0ASN4_9ACTN
MSRVVFVHGIAQETKGAETLLEAWYPALADGLSLAGRDLGGDAGRDTGRPDLVREQVSMAFYGDLFRPAGHRGLGVPELDASDVQEGLETELLLGWWESAAAQENRVAGPEAAARLRTPRLVQRALDALSHSVFFAGIAERLMISSARQVRRYFTEPAIRAAVQQRFAECLTDETEVVVAHSLGSVVAYETLCARPGRPALTLITMGSPLGVRNLVFDRLVPPPAGGPAAWPPPVRHWVNIADRGDAVALTKTLAPLFGERVHDVLVHNGATAHDVRPYLTARETGAAIARALRR